MPELAMNSVNWFEMKGIAVRLQDKIVLEKVDWIFGKNDRGRFDMATLKKRETN